MSKQVNSISKGELIEAAELKNIANKTVEFANELGAHQAEARLSNQLGQSINVRKQQLESVELHNDRSLTVNVFLQHCTGSASTADLSDEGIRATVSAAMSIAKQTEADTCFGLADQQLLADFNIDNNNLDQMHDWDMSFAEMIETAKQCEQAGFDLDNRISNSEGAAINSFSAVSVYANSHGFIGSSHGSSHSISCSFVAEQNGDMQRDYWYHSDCNPAKLESPSKIGELAAQRTVRRLGARQVPTCEVPVIFDSTIAGSLFSHFISAISGGALYKKASFLVDHLGERIFPDWFSLAENPHLKGQYRSAYYDLEGVATPASRTIVNQGCLQGYVLGSFTSRKLGMQTTGNAGGVRNVTTTDTDNNLEGLLKDMGTGLLVTELIGSGVNLVTGDYSRGAAGFWVENGEIQYPVQELTIASNLRDMYSRITQIGNDTDKRGNIHTGSVMLEAMTVAGG